MLKHPDPCHDTDTHTPVSTPPSPKLTCVLLMVYPCDCFVEVALCTPLFAEGLSAWAMNKMRTHHSQVSQMMSVYVLLHTNNAKTKIEHSQRQKP